MENEIDNVLSVSSFTVHIIDFGKTYLKAVKHYVTDGDTDACFLFFLFFGGRGVNSQYRVSRTWE